VTPSATPLTTDDLLKRGLWLEYATLAWNVVGTPLMIATAVRAGSTALAAFGLDSLIEIFASVIVVWQLKGVAAGREALALRLIGSAFFLLAAYILFQSLWTLITHAQPAPSPIGMAWLVVTVAAMALLAYGKLATGRALGNLVLRTEARVTMIDGALAAAVLAGVSLNAIAGWWWADPTAGLGSSITGSRRVWRLSVVSAVPAPPFAEPVRR
jgi:divalent metal cation (Fe/Co/Zn/Cd) transporter